MDHWEEWQKVYQHGTIVIWPPAEAREIVNHQREKYDPVSASFCGAHITLTQPLLNPLSDAEWGNIQDILRGFPAFEIQYGPIKSFLPYPCIWYEIQPGDKILALRHALHQMGYFNLSLKHTDVFIPHMSITEGLSGPPVDEELLTILQEQSSQGSFVCQDAVHIVPDESFCFGVEKRLSLDGGK
ncbi:MAG: 2'-5' RNA ligase family protein [Anaerolineales bacterium]